ncbi:hypothetical protein IJ135_01765, partial [Candidatus Saccharibacteria bacterium]|nr:hypothetical protein [Candidatus Saccharibacteria bacterium]
MNVEKFAIGTEKLVNPMAVGKTHYLQTRLARLPVCMQQKIVKSVTKKAGQMPFIVEPYAFFLFYELPEPSRVEKYLPSGFAPVASSIFTGDPEKYYGIVSIIRLHTSVFWGARAEFYLVAKDEKTGLTSWVMEDYLSDTISYDEVHGLKSPDCTSAVVTTTCEGDFLAEMEDTRTSGRLRRRLSVAASLKNAKLRPLDQRLWVEGNTSIAYGRLVGQADGDLFSLTFMPEEMHEALEVPLTDVRRAVAHATTTRTGGVLERAVCFPYAQHMLSDAPGV